VRADLDRGAALGRGPGRERVQRSGRPAEEHGGERPVDDEDGVQHELARAGGVDEILRTPVGRAGGHRRDGGQGGEEGAETSDHR
jgi:hypothetical protein